MTRSGASPEGKLSFRLSWEALAANDLGLFNLAIPTVF
jgi:hypothetical protein